MTRVLNTQLILIFLFLGHSIPPNFVLTRAPEAETSR